LDQQETKPLWFVDASQAVPHLHIDVTSLWVDALYFTGHKLWAITGIGVLWWRKELLEWLKPARWWWWMVEEVTMDWYTVQWAPDKFEPGTPNLVGAISLLLAIEYIESIGDWGLQWWYTQLDMIEKPLMKYCFEQFKLLENNDIRLLWPTDLEKKIWVFSFQLPVWKNATQLGQFMATKNICIRCGAQCAHIFHAWLEDTIWWKSCVQQTCRISLWGYNDVAELAIFFSALRTFLN
jgi:cysteine desulfurase/selenocysteine lyase